MSQPVAVVRCADYDAGRVNAAVERALELLGGMSRFVQPGQKVLLKVNLLSSSAPEKAITTHPALVEAVVQAVQAAGGRAMIGDSPGGSVRYTPPNLQRVYQVTGMAGVADRTGAELMLDTSSRETPIPNGRLVKRLDIIQPALDADVIVNLPKFKTHVLTTFTGATKNLLGTVPGAQKALLHVTSRNLANFAALLIDIMEFHHPPLTIMDAIVGMEGNGPGSGRPRQVGAVLASADGVALDVVAAEIAGLEAAHIPTLREAAGRGLWSGIVADVPTVGEPLAGVKLADFVPARPNRHPNGGSGIPVIDRVIGPVLVNWLAVRPVPRAGRCTACRSCIRTCPREAIRIRDGLAVVDYGRCVRCYCCHEMCPESAIDLEQPWLRRLIH